MDAWELSGDPGSVSTGCLKGRAVRAGRPVRRLENCALAAIEAFRSAPLPDLRAMPPEWPLDTRQRPFEVGDRLSGTPADSRKAGVWDQLYGYLLTPVVWGLAPKARQAPSLHCSCLMICWLWVIACRSTAISSSSRAKRTMSENGAVSRLAGRCYILLFLLVAPPTPARSSTPELILPQVGDVLATSGQTLMAAGREFQIAGIRAPLETRRACFYEDLRGRKARRALQHLISTGPVSIRLTGSVSRRGITLAQVHVNGRDVGEMLIRQGLVLRRRAHEQGNPWCDWLLRR